MMRHPIVESLMRPRLLALVLLPGLAFPCCPLNAQAMSAREARDDVVLAISLVEAALPDLFWHQTPAEWDAAKARALGDAEHADEAMDVQVAIARLMEHIGEGHLDVLPSPAARAHQRAHASLLPLDLHWSTEGIFVSGTRGGADAPPVGSRLLAIGDDDAAALLEELASVSSRDGRILTGPMRECAGSCYAVLRQRIRGHEDAFVVTYQHPAGPVRSVRLPAQPMALLPPPASGRRRIANLEWIEPRLAYLEVSTFSNRVYREAGTSFPAVIGALFAQIEAAGADRLILDLRENGGGSEPNEAILFSHLVAEPIHRYRSVEARGRVLSVAAPGGEVLTHEVFDDEEFARQHEVDGRLFRRDLPPEGLRSHWTPSAPVFTGELVVLAGGKTFSGGAELAAMLRRVGRGRFVGEETGGAYEGNTSGYTWDVTLPHSGVELGIPLLKFRFDWDAELPGRGVMPDCDVPPRVEEIGVQRDHAWKVALWLVQREAGDVFRCPTPGEIAPPA